MNTFRMSKVALLSLLVASASMLVGCATPSSSGSVYRAGEARREQTVRTGVVQSIREVTIENDRTGVGAVTGAVVGGVAGSNVGKGRGQAIGTVLGAVAGGVAGQAIEGRVGKVRGYEITVRMDSGEVRSIVQEADESFSVGQRVRIVSNGATSRVSP